MLRPLSGMSEWIVHDAVVLFKDAVHGQCVKMDMEIEATAEASRKRDSAGLGASDADGAPRRARDLLGEDAADCGQDAGLGRREAAQFKGERQDPLTNGRIGQMQSAICAASSHMRLAPQLGQTSATNGLSYAYQGSVVLTVTTLRALVELAKKYVWWQAPEVSLARTMCESMLSMRFLPRAIAARCRPSEHLSSPWRDAALVHVCEQLVKDLIACRSIEVC